MASTIELLEDRQSGGKENEKKEKKEEKSRTEKKKREKGQHKQYLFNLD